MSIAQRAASGAAWNIVTSLGARVVALVGTLVVTRFLSPGDYGEVMAAVIVAQTCLTLSQLGIVHYLVVRPSSGPDVAFHVTVYTTVVCAATLGAALLAHGPLTSFFGVHELERYLPWLCLATMADRIASVPERLLYRDLRFRYVALARAAGEITFAVASMGLAALGEGGMGIVAASVLRSLLRSTLFVAAIDARAWIRPCALRWSTTRALLAFGLPLSVSCVAGAVATRWDNMITLRCFGASAMGAYNLAYSLAEVPVTQVGEQIGDVLLPSFAQMAPVERRRALGRATALLAIVVFPLAVGLAAVSATLVRVAFDARWASVAPMLTALAALAVARPVSYVMTSYLQADARVFTVSAIEVAKTALLVALMVLASPFGIMALCGAVGGAFMFQAAATLWAVTRDGLSLRRIALGLAGPLLATVPMAAAVLATRSGLAVAGLGSPIFGLALEIVVGAVVYVGAAFLIAGDTARDLLSLARAAVARRREADAVPA